MCWFFVFLLLRFRHSLNLVGEGKAGKSLTETENVPVTGKDHDGNLFLAKTILELEVEVDVVNARHVARAGWRWVLGVEGEREDVDEYVGNVRVVLVGLYQSEPRTRFVRKT